MNGGSTIAAIHARLTAVRQSAVVGSTRANAGSRPYPAVAPYKQRTFSRDQLTTFGY